MYTKCPQCHVAFRVTARILQQANGNVRCGSCNHAFNALAFLSEDMPPPGNQPLPDDFAETNRRLLETLDELAGAAEVRIEDTGIEWRVLDGDEDQAEEGHQEELRYDDNTPLPDDFGEEIEEEYFPPVPQRRTEDQAATAGGIDSRQAGLALSDPEDWTDLLDEFTDPDRDLLEVEEELAAIHTQLSTRDVSSVPESEPEASDVVVETEGEGDIAVNVDFDLTAEDGSGGESDLDLVLTESESEVDVVLSNEESEPDVVLNAENSEPDLVLAGAVSDAVTEDYERWSETDFDVDADETGDDTDRTLTLGDADEAEGTLALDEGDEIDDLRALDEADEVEEALAPDDGDETEDRQMPDEADEVEVDLALEESDEPADLELSDVETPPQGAYSGQRAALVEDVTADDDAAGDEAPVLTIQADGTEVPEPERENPDLYVPPPSEEEMTVNMEIDQELLAAAARDDDEFSATLVGMDRPEDFFGKNPEEVETIIMEGEFIRTAMDQERLAGDRTDTDAFAEGADLADTYALSRDRARGRRWKFEKPGIGMSLLALLLAVTLGLQYLHYSRESLATMGFFNQTVAPVYRMLGMPVTPEWDIRGWQFESTNGSVNDDESVLTIVTRIGNRSDQALPYPLIHVSLTDRFEDVMGSRILEPGDYLAGEGDPSRPVQPGNNFTAIITIREPSVDATGFKLNVCYRVTQGTVRCAIEDFKN